MTDSDVERWVEVNAARDEWAVAAGDVLTEVAGHYLGVVTYTDLAEQVQVRTKLRTRSHSRNWIGSVLAQVATRSRAAGLPPLTSLVAHRADGGIEPDESTVKARLACYRRFADDIPDHVIVQADEDARAEAAAAAEAERARRSKPRASTPRAARPKTRTPARQEEAPKICPTCFMQLPASGVCDSCG